MATLLRLRAWFGGTFDPVHLGHLHIAQDVVNELGLTELALLPCQQPVHKQAPGVTTEHRLAMLALACQHHRQLAIDQRELQREAASFTVLTLTELRQQYPNDALAFVIGMDSFNQLHLWREWRQILQLCHLIVCPRPGYAQHADDAVQQAITVAATPEPLYQQTAGLVYFAHSELLPIASSTVRTQLAAHRELAQAALPAAVFDYIQHHQLYLRG